VVVLRDDSNTFCKYIALHPPNIDRIVDQYIESRDLEGNLDGIYYVATYCYKTTDGKVMTVTLDQYCGRTDDDSHDSEGIKAPAVRVLELDQRIRDAVEQMGGRLRKGEPRARLSERASTFGDQTEGGMYCVKCGAQLPADASFCVKCGAPQRADAVASGATAEPLWETLEIEAEQPNKGLASYAFIGRVHTPQGSYQAWRREFGGSRNEPIELVTGYHREYAQDILSDINKDALNVGWERLPKGNFWYSNRYRRPIDPKDLHACILCLEIVRSGAFRQTVQWVARAAVGMRTVTASSEFTMGKRLKPDDPAAIKALDELNMKLKDIGGWGTFKNINISKWEPEIPTE
jgi:hypothetical protein